MNNHQILTHNLPSPISLALRMSKQKNNFSNNIKVNSNNDVESEYDPENINFINKNKKYNNVEVEPIKIDLTGLGIILVFIIILLILSWVLYFYGLIKAFKCTYNKVLHVLAAFFMFPIYHLYILFAGCYTGPKGGLNSRRN